MSLCSGVTSHRGHLRLASPRSSSRLFDGTPDCGEALRIPPTQHPRPGRPCPGRETGKSHQRRHSVLRKQERLREHGDRFGEFHDRQEHIELGERSAEGRVPWQSPVGCAVHAQGWQRLAICARDIPRAQRRMGRLASASEEAPGGLRTSVPEPAADHDILHGSTAFGSPRTRSWRPPRRGDWGHVTLSMYSSRSFGVAWKMLIHCSSPYTPPL